MPDVVTSVTRPKLTSDVDDFFSGLRDGDVLLFDSLHPVSHLIKLVDNSPVNHCSLYERPGQIIHAALPLQDGTSVRREPLRDRLARGHDRTVTAFRPSDRSIGSTVLHTAHEWLDQTTRYGFKALFGLFAQCINRSYGRELGKVEKALLYQASRAMSALSATAVSSPAELSVTCSEFVYSCFIAADPASIEIPDPLAIWLKGMRATTYQDPARRESASLALAVDRDTEPHPALQFVDQDKDAHAPRRAVGGFPNGEDYKLFGDVNPSLPTAISRLTYHASGADELSFDAIVASERNELADEMLENHRGGKSVPVGRQEPSPYAQTITPFDLWQSPSLTAVRILHVPPGQRDPVRLRSGGRVWPGR